MTSRQIQQLTFGQGVRYRRGQLGLTQRQLADRMAVSQNTLSRWESMGEAPRDHYTIEKLAELLHADPNDLRHGIVRDLRGEGVGAVHEQIVRLAMDHATGPEAVNTTVAVIVGVLGLPLEGVRRVKDYVDLLIEHYGKGTSPTRPTGTAQHE